MIKAPGMLVVGAVGRGAGKTKLACSLIERFSSQHKITGIKVTAIEQADDSCPRGGQGCGVCSSLDGHYYISEETDSRLEKDTGKMLAAGASRVFWLRALKPHLEEAVAALLDIIGGEVLSICESNSLRKVVEPGLFVMVRSGDADECKPSAKEVIRHADRIVSFDGNEFDTDLTDISIIDGKWAIRAQATAIILAGGKSVRMGQDKSMLPIRDKPMIKHIVDQLRGHFNQTLISSNDVSRYGFAGVEIIPDRLAGQGPLMGIASALKVSVNDINFVTACDIPQVDTDLMKMMLREVGNCDIVVPRISESQYEPLFAVYRKSIVDIANELLASGQRRIAALFNRCRTRYIDLAGTQQLRNLNTMSDYQEFVRKQNSVTI